MQKTEILRLSRYLIFLAIFNAFFFMLGGVEHNASVWISYGFIHFACFTLMITSRLLVSDAKNDPVYKLPLYFISLVYFIAEFFIGVIFILIAPEGYTAAFLIQLSLAGVYGIALIYYLIANVWTADAEKERQVHISFIKDASVKMKGLVDSVSDKDVRKKVERVYDALYSSPVKSHPELATTEERILRSIRTLESAIAAGDRDEIVSLAGSLETAINERNRQLKTYN